MFMKIGETKPMEAKHGWRQHLVRQPRHKWFSAPDRKCEDGWYGPHETIEAAVIECANNYGTESPIFVGQGYKLTKSEREDWGAEKLQRPVGPLGMVIKPSQGCDQRQVLSLIISSKAKFNPRLQMNKTLPRLNRIGAISVSGVCRSTATVKIDGHQPAGL